MEQLIHQMSLFEDETPYKYIIDTCSILAQKDGDTHPRSIHKSMWQDIDSLIKDNIIVISREIMEEVDDKEIKNNLLELEPKIIEINEEIQVNVKKVLKECPELIDFAKVKSSGDAFLIATAMVYGLIVITEENADSPKKIPKVCEKLNVDCINILGLCKMQKWSY